MRITIVFQDTNRGWGKRMASFLEENSPESWQVNLKQIAPIKLPVIDNPDKFLPDNMAAADLLIVLAETSSCGQLIPELTARAEAEALIAPVDFEKGLPSGLQKQIKDELEEMGIKFALPEPFCSLTARGYQSKRIEEFASHFGRPALDFACEKGEIREVAVSRSSPCGGTHFVAEELKGVDSEKASQKAGLAHQYYPCMASVDIIHRSAHITEAAVKRARKNCNEKIDSVKPTS